MKVNRVTPFRVDAAQLNLETLGGLLPRLEKRMDNNTQTLIVSIVGLLSTTITAALGLFFTAKSRRAPLRQHLYQTQVKLVTQALRIIGKIRTLSPMVWDRDNPYYEQALSDLRARVRQLSEASDSAAAILPTELYVEISRLGRLMVDFLTQIDDGEDTTDFPGKLAGQSAKTALLARTYLGVDELSEESAKLFTTAEELKKVAGLRPGDIVSDFKLRNDPAPETT